MNKDLLEEYQNDECVDENICPECGEKLFVSEEVYGEDADGNRGIVVVVWDCPNCGFGD